MRKKTLTRPTLLSVYDEDLQRLQERVGKDRSQRTLASMRQGRGYVSRFLSERLSVADLPLDALRPQLIRDFSIYLSVDRGLRGGTVWLACQQLKGVVTRAHQRGLMTWNPFAGFHIAKNIRPREYLTEQEIAQLMKHHFRKEPLSFARDIFVFAAFTGLAFVDINELRSENIVEINGSKWIVSRRHKTQVPFQVKLLDIPLQILQKYRNGGDRIFGKMEYRTMAKRIGRVMQEVGIRKRITLHCARHSFAVLALDNGMPIESLSRMLGHTNITTTQIYAKITLQKLDQDMTRLAERLGSGKTT